MLLESINVLNYRNITQSDLTFSPGINCFVGDNGAGKTNMLDAIYYLSFCKSFFNSIDSQNIKHDENFFVLQGKYEKNNMKEEIYCGVKQNQKKQFKRNKKEYPKLSDHIGFIPLVFISPSDELLIMDGSEIRRKYMDGVISQYDHYYLELIIRYSRILLQRNKLLKDMAQSGKHDLSLLEAIDLQLVNTGNLIYNKRATFINELIPVFERHFTNISGGKEKVEIIYKSHLSLNNFKEQLIQNQKKDLILGYTTIGIHKDDLDFNLNNFQLKKEGSQGQKKTFAIALKLAQFDFLATHQNVKPILLLDDIFDKLDDKRGSSLLKLVAEDHFNQIFLTHTNKLNIETILNVTGKQFKIFEVSNGNIIF
ncbi:MAG: DNA replication and repair protein RecF [Marinilabiliaceae bacterium]|nr:DNA replication and repair protein RecF [Marinilabiliaceae bacterium]